MDFKTSRSPPFHHILPGKIDVKWTILEHWRKLMHCQISFVLQSFEPRLRPQLALDWRTNICQLRLCQAFLVCCSRQLPQEPVFIRDIVFRSKRPQIRLVLETLVDALGDQAPILDRLMLTYSLHIIAVNDTSINCNIMQSASIFVHYIILILISI